MKKETPKELKEAAESLSCTCAARLALVRKVVGIVNISDTSHLNDDDEDDED